MKKLMLILVLLSLFNISVYANDKPTYNVDPCFGGDYRDACTFEEYGYMKTSKGNLSYDEYYSIAEKDIPYDVDSVLIINGNFIPHQFPKIIDGVSIIPIRTIIENFGGQITWDSVNKKVEFYKDDLKVELIINNIKSIVNGKRIDLKVAPQIIDEKTYVPLKFIGELLDADVKFLEGKKGIFPNIIFITKKETSQSILISKKQAHEMVSEYFSKIEWGDFIEEFNGDVNTKFEFIIEESPIANFWVVNIKYDGDLLYPVSVWVDIYTGKLYATEGGYEGVFGVRDGLERLKSSIAYIRFL